MNFLPVYFLAPRETLVRVAYDCSNPVYGKINEPQEDICPLGVRLSSCTK